MSLQLLNFLAKKQHFGVLLFCVKKLFKFFILSQDVAREKSSETYFRSALCDILFKETKIVCFAKVINNQHQKQSGLKLFKFQNRGLFLDALNDELIKEY